jgi:pyridoxal phosphate enzyme (YggS family)
VRARIEAACLRARREPGSVSLLAVTKTFPPAVVAEAAAAGQWDFGENYVQEWREKAESPDLRVLPVRWHFIGGLQRNKVKHLVGRVETIGTVSDLSLAQEVSRRAGAEPQAVLLQVRIGGEGSKGGFEPADMPARMPELLALPGVRIRGLLSIPPYREDPEHSRPDHQALRALRDDLEDRFGHPLPVLSMGMSHDLEAAILEGATQVRVGTAIFLRRA